MARQGGQTAPQKNGSDAFLTPISLFGAYEGLEGNPSDGEKDNCFEVV